MPKSLLEQLPEIVANGRKQAERILESIEGRHRVQLQTREIVLPAKDAAAHDWIDSQQRQAQRDTVFCHAQGNLIEPVQPGHSPATESAGYTIQLPTNLLARISKATSIFGGFVADFNGGSSIEWQEKNCTAQSGRVALLVGGINATYKSLRAWGDVYAARGYCVAGFNYDYRNKTLTENAAEMADALIDMGNAGAKDVVIVAHSMGGLVSRAAVLKAGEGGAWKYESVGLIAISTPWGGFAAANPTQWMPFSGAICKLIGKPMGTEIGQNAPFMESLSGSLPTNVSLIVYEGGADGISAPETERGKKLYEANVAAARNRIHVESAGHMGLLDPLVVAGI